MRTASIYISCVLRWLGIQHGIASMFYLCPWAWARITFYGQTMRRSFQSGHFIDVKINEKLQFNY